MENLKRLYEEVTPKFCKLKSKYGEMDKRTHELRNEIEQAKSDYDPKKVTKLTAEETSTYQVRDRIREDLEKYQKDFGGLSLYRKVEGAVNADFKNDNKVMQPLFIERDELAKRIQEIDEIVKKESATVREKYQEEVVKFKDVVGQGHGSHLLTMMGRTGYYPDFEEEKA